jgi:hypothetical protein
MGGRCRFLRPETARSPPKQKRPPEGGPSHALEVAVADRELQVPAHGPEDHVRRKAEAAEGGLVGGHGQGSWIGAGERCLSPLRALRLMQQIRIGARAFLS